MTSVEILSFTGTTPAQVYYCDSMSANCVFVASVSTFPYTFNVPSPYDNNNFIVKVTDAQNCTILEYVYILPTPSPTVTNTQFLTPSETPTYTPTLSQTPTNTVSVTPTKTAPVPTPSRTPAQTPIPPCESPTPTLTPTTTITPTITLGVSPTSTPTLTPTPSVTPSFTPTATETPSQTPSNTPTLTESPTPTITSSETQTPTPSVTSTLTPTETPTQTQTSTTTITPSITGSAPVTPSVTPTFTPSPSQTPAVETVAFLFVESNAVATRNTFNTYMAGQGSTFRGFNLNSPTLNNSTTFNRQMNAYVRYSGWGGVQPSIKTGVTYNLSRGVDNFGVPISANTLTTSLVNIGTTTPGNTIAWYTWIIPTGSTGSQRYSTLSLTFNNATGTTMVQQRANMSSILFNYTGGTNIPNGTYRVYSTFTNQQFRFAQNNRNIYFRGGSLI